MRTERPCDATTTGGDGPTRWLAYARRVRVRPSSIVVASLLLLGCSGEDDDTKGNGSGVGTAAAGGAAGNGNLGLGGRAGAGAKAGSGGEAGGGASNAGTSGAAGIAGQVGAGAKGGSEAGKAGTGGNGGATAQGGTNGGTAGANAGNAGQAGASGSAAGDGGTGGSGGSAGSAGAGGASVSAGAGGASGSGGTEGGASGSPGTAGAAGTAGTSGAAGSPPAPGCGNGVRDPGEICDGAALGSMGVCSTYVQGGSSAPIGCTPECLPDVAACASPTNGLQDPGETDIDCGGTGGVRCHLGERCVVDQDCEIFAGTQLACVLGTCNALRIGTTSAQVSMSKGQTVSLGVVIASLVPLPADAQLEVMAFGGVTIVSSAPVLNGVPTRGIGVDLALAPVDENTSGSTGLQAVLTGAGRTRTEIVPSFAFLASPPAAKPLGAPPRPLVRRGACAGNVSAPLPVLDDAIDVPVGATICVELDPADPYRSNTTALRVGGFSPVDRGGGKFELTVPTELTLHEAFPAYARLSITSLIASATPGSYVYPGTLRVTAFQAAGVGGGGTPSGFGTDADPRTVALVDILGGASTVPGDFVQLRGVFDLPAPLPQTKRLQGRPAGMGTPTLIRPGAADARLDLVSGPVTLDDLTILRAVSPPGQMPCVQSFASRAILRGVQISSCEIGLRAQRDLVLHDVRFFDDGTALEVSFGGATPPILTMLTSRVTGAATGVKVGQISTRVRDTIFEQNAAAFATFEAPGNGSNPHAVKLSLFRENKRALSMEGTDTAVRFSATTIDGKGAADAEGLVSAGAASALFVRSTTLSGLGGGAIRALDGTTVLLSGSHVESSGRLVHPGGPRAAISGEGGALQIVGTTVRGSLGAGILATASTAPLALAGVTVQDAAGPLIDDAAQGAIDFHDVFLSSSTARSLTSPLVDFKRGGPAVAGDTIQRLTLHAADGAVVTSHPAPALCNDVDDPKGGRYVTVVPGGRFCF